MGSSRRNGWMSISMRVWHCQSAPPCTPMLFDTDVQFSTFLYFELQEKRCFLLSIYCFRFCVFLGLTPLTWNCIFWKRLFRTIIVMVQTHQLYCFFQFHCRGKSFLGKPCPPDMLFETPNWGGGNAFWVTRPVYIYIVVLLAYAR